MMWAKRLIPWIVVGCIVALIAGYSYASVRGWTQAKVERAVNQALPPGCDRVQIEAFLDARGWRHRYSQEGMWLRFYGGRAGLRGDRIEAMIHAEVPDPNVGPFGEGSITVFFFLDREGRLIKSYVEVWILSL